MISVLIIDKDGNKVAPVNRCNEVSLRFKGEKDVLTFKPNPDGNSELTIVIDEIDMLYMDEIAGEVL